MATPHLELEVGERSVRISNPQKVYWAALGEDGGRKIDLVQYYLAVGPGILRALRARPTYLQRFPDGVEGEEIYQKRVPEYAPEWVGRARVSFPSGRHADALCVEELAAVAWAANLGTVTFHPWPTDCADVDHPNRLRIDLDPQPGTGFEEARRVALGPVRELLDELGCAGFPKTSGGRGVHVDVPIEARWGFTDVRRAALAFGREVERRAPMEVTTAWWKEQRGAQVFVDYNQNARDRTIASAFSLRRTARATASTPVTWEELVDVEPDDLTIRTVPARFAAVGDPGAEADTMAFSLDLLLLMADRDEADRGLGDAPYPPNYPKMPGEPARVQPSRRKRLTSEDAAE